MNLLPSWSEYSFSIPEASTWSTLEVDSMSSKGEDGPSIFPASSSIFASDTSPFRAASAKMSHRPSSRLAHRAGARWMIE